MVMVAVCVTRALLNTEPSRGSGFDTIRVNVGGRYFDISDFCRHHAAAKNTFSQRTTGFLSRFSVTNGKLYESQASIPPSSGRTLVIPLARSSSATRVLVASLGHEQ
jgi:hypothetical protein